MFMGMRPDSSIEIRKTAHAMNKKFNKGTDILKKKKEILEMQVQEFKHIAERLKKEQSKQMNDRAFKISKSDKKKKRGSIKKNNKMRGKMWKQISIDMAKVLSLFSDLVGWVLVLWEQFWENLLCHVPIGLLRSFWRNFRNFTSRQPSTQRDLTGREERRENQRFIPNQ